MRRKVLAIDDEIHMLYLLERLLEGLAAAGFEPDADSADSVPQIA